MFSRNLGCINATFITLLPVGVQCIAMYVYLSVWLFVRSYVPKATCPNFHSQRWFYWVSIGCIYLVLRFSSISVILCFVTAMSLSVLYLYHCMTYCFRVIVSRPTLLSLVGSAHYCSYYLLHANVMFSEHIKFDFTWLTDHVCINRPHLRIGSTEMQPKSINLWLLSLF